MDLEIKIKGHIDDKHNCDVEIGLIHNINSDKEYRFYSNTNWNFGTSEKDRGLNLDDIDAIRDIIDTVNSSDIFNRQK